MGGSCYSNGAARAFDIIFFDDPEDIHDDDDDEESGPGDFGKLVLYRRGMSPWRSFI